MLVFHAHFKWMHLFATALSGGEAKWFTVVGHDDLGVTVYHPGKEPEELEWWADHVAECLEGLKGTAKCHGVVRSAPDGPIVGVLWTKAPGKMLFQNTPTTVEDRVRYALRCVVVLMEMNKRGLLFSDIKGNNILRDEKNEPTFIDLLSCTSMCDLEFPDGSIKPRHFGMGSGEYLAPELLVPGTPVVQTVVTIAHAVLVLVWMVLKDNFPFDLVNEYGCKLPFDEIKIKKYYGQFAGTLPARLKPLDAGIPYVELPELMRWVFELGFIQGRLAPQVRPSIEQVRDCLQTWDDALTQEKKEKAMKKKLLWGGGVLATLAAGFLAAMFGLPLLEKKAQGVPAPEPQAITPLVTQEPPEAHEPQQPPQVRDDERPNIWRGAWQRE
jgi:hypothetical protein